MKTGIRVTIAAIAAAASWSALAQQPQGERVRGTIEKLDGNVLSEIGRAHV